MAKKESLWDEYEMEITLLEPMLGTIPKDPDVYAQHVRHKLAKDDEVVEYTPEEIEEKGWTGFYTDSKGRPIIYDYQIKGFLKESANTLKDALGLKALRSRVDSELFVFPRTTVLADKPDGNLERPLRAMTPLGPRVSVVRSDLIKEGRTYTFRLHVLKGSRITEKVLAALLEYGALKGLGQWRNGGYGRFEAKLKKV